MPVNIIVEEQCVGYDDDELQGFRKFLDVLWIDTWESRGVGSYSQ